MKLLRLAQQQITRLGPTESNFGAEGDGLPLEKNDAAVYVHQHESLEKEHGRIETRRTVISKDLEWPP